MGLVPLAASCLINGVCWMSDAIAVFWWLQCTRKAEDNQLKLYLRDREQMFREIRTFSGSVHRADVAVQPCTKNVCTTA